MKLSLILLFLQLWGRVEVSLSENVCSELPNVPHAHVSEGTSKDVYQEGDVIYFLCESGYISDQISKFVCTTDGWLVARQGKCYSCSTLPDVPNAYVTEVTRKAHYQTGDMIYFDCEPGYTSALAIKYVCTNDGWQALHQGSCYLPASRCDPPSTVHGLTVKGLPKNSMPIHPDHILTFSCDGPAKYLNGVSVLICGSDGKWNNPFPTCIDRSCKVGVMHPHLYVAGLPPSNEIMATGHKLRFLCSNAHALEGSTEIECLENGQWNSPFPTCSVRCPTPPDVPNAQVTQETRKAEYQERDMIHFDCEPGYASALAIKYVCTNEGWQALHQGSCYPDKSCGRPPPLSDGDTKISTKYKYQHNERVEYICQQYFIMDGGPFKTCVDGEWTGEIRCLKPCTLNRQEMNNLNIWFRYTRDDKPYAEHNDVIEFICVRGKYVGGLAMHQRCENGVIRLPVCQYWIPN